ncbi:MAG: hypothetical protein ACYDCC_06340 [Actinomycetota bacterium]
MPRTIEVCLATGAKRVVAAALDWPGWCRLAKDERSAIEMLDAYRGRYVLAIDGSRAPVRPRDWRSPNV